jgi:NADPH-dependent curcumin reductase CurA
MPVNRQWLFAARPHGFPTHDCFRLEEAPVPALGADQVLVRNLYMSVDPYMRGRMNEMKSYVAGFQLGQPLEGGAIGQVLESRNSAFAQGDCVASMMGWREYFVSDGGGLTKVNPRLAPLSTYLGVLGVPGFTGWYGLKYIGEPKAGETLVVSGAAGATGSFVVQMGKILGCRVVGTAGSDEKCAWLTRDLGADAAINYKREPDLIAALRRTCPQGVDIYFENVGGAMLEAVLASVNTFARIVVCGMISQYNATAPEPGPRYLTSLIINRVKMQGFLITDHMNRYLEFLGEAGAWLQAGKMKYQETVVHGIENAPQAFLGLLRGENTGKMLVKLSDPA